MENRDFSYLVINRGTPSGQRLFFQVGMMHLLLSGSGMNGGQTRYGHPSGCRSFYQIADGASNQYHSQQRPPPGIATVPRTAGVLQLDANLKVARRTSGGIGHFNKDRPGLSTVRTDDRRSVGQQPGNPAVGCVAAP
jgi:hypothetical protein